MHASRVLLPLLLLISLSIVFSNVHAQTTSISELSYPPGLPQDTLSPISVTATVSYRDAGPGYTLVVGILDMDRSPPSFVSGFAMGSPDACVNQPILSAWCVSKTSGSSGTEHLEFKIGGILGDSRTAGSWKLNMTAALYNANNTLVASSVSSVPFTISVSPSVLTVVVPAKAVVWVDGVKQQPGTIQIPVDAGAHNVTVPSIVEVDAGTRLRFDHWKDGPTQPNRTVTISLSRIFEAVYVTQYRLSIAGQTASTAGEGWYDSGYTATFSVAETDQMNGLLGLLGGRLRFQGWYENNKLLSDSPVDHLIMNQPHTLTVLWQADYTMPIIIVGLLALVVFVLAYVAMRRRTALTASEPSLPSRETTQVEPESRVGTKKPSRRTPRRRSRSSVRRRRSP